MDKRKIFMDDEDHYRFIHDLFEFNDKEPVGTTFRVFQKFQQLNVTKKRTVRKAERDRRPRKLIVNIHAFCLMPNHYHLLLSPRIEAGITKFMHKLNMGYCRYFNEKYERRGRLFEGVYKSIALKTDAHFIHLPYYIHLNPLDLFSPEWRARELNDFKGAISFLNSYRWSSHLDYAGVKNFPSVTQRELLLKFFGNSNEYKKDIKQWLRKLDLESLGVLKLE